jgi:hypothetical protein
MTDDPTLWRHSFLGVLSFIFPIQFSQFTYISVKAVILAFGSATLAENQIAYQTLDRFHPRLWSPDEWIPKLSQITSRCPMRDESQLVNTRPCDNYIDGLHTPTGTILPFGPCLAQFPGSLSTKFFSARSDTLVMQNHQVLPGQSTSHWSRDLRWCSCATAGTSYTKCWGLNSPVCRLATAIFLFLRHIGCTWVLMGLLWVVPYISLLMSNCG